MGVSKVNFDVSLIKTTSRFDLWHLTSSRATWRSFPVLANKFGRLNKSILLQLKQSFSAFLVNVISSISCFIIIQESIIILPTITMISSIVNANTKAVSLLEHGMHQDAVRVLSAAVKQCASSLFDSHSQPVSPEYTPSADLFVETSVSSKPSDLASHETDMFSRPFVMLVNEMQDCTGRELLAGCAAVCFYNMGLACHLEWVKRNRNDSRVLSQAHLFYGKAYNALQLCQLKPSDSLLLLFMALCTNLIDVNLELGQLTTVQTFKENLTSVIFYADKHQYSGNASFRYLYQTTVLFRSELVAARAA